MKNNSKYHSGENAIIKFLNGEFTNSDHKKFINWLNENPENKKLFDETKKLWDHSNNLLSIESIDVDKDWQKTKQRMNFAQDKLKSSTFKRNKIQFWKIAATIIILLGIGILSKQYLITTPEMIFVETGEFKKEITLPDGSTVFLNKNSELAYPEKFKRNQRLVSLSGEGFFEVVKNPTKRFQININEQAVVEVLGTSFNINSEKENGFVDINVLSGKVAFYTPEKENEKTILTKDENALLQDGIISKNREKDKNFLSWRTGVIFFEEEKIENVCKALSQFYDRTVIVEGLENKEIRFSSTIDNQKLKNVLDEIKLVLNLDYTVAKEKIVIHKPH
ncbi:MAG: FecR family protein [Prolixibacteraceae bacterium]|jgi:transmembrane sensor|nr:FecR family protein [Prolixibacteraceae bacterium]MBT6004439.1 FecR family protein [Prolixibacteraceae bacterium]MBT6763054.1 FecR family protein [Prolixibacteraceae bacterium]MBT6998701.1 FecR family protein [Prolixibacteraceae bacterium]